MALEEEKAEMEMAVKDIEEEEEDDELGSKERVLYKYFLLEWKLVSSLLNDIVSHGRVTDPSSVYTIRSIVLSLSLSDPFFVSLRLMFFVFVLNIYYVCKCWNELLGSQCDTSAVCFSFGFGSFFVFYVFFSINFTLHSLF